jgi:hypothetical protein
VTKTSVYLLKIFISIASAIGTVHVWLITREAILSHYSWCGTGRLIRYEQILPYLVFFVPSALIVVISTWKKISKIDYVTKVSCLSFLSVMVLYWFFEGYSDTLFQWLFTD